MRYLFGHTVLDSLHSGLSMANWMLTGCCREVDKQNPAWRTLARFVQYEFELVSVGMHVGRTLVLRLI